MPGVTEGITIDGQIRARAVFDQILRRTEDMSPLMARIGAYGEESSMHRFETETGPDGKKWQQSERAKATGGQTLSDTGRFRQSVTHRSDSASAEWGTNLIYAPPHQFGMDGEQPVAAHIRRITQAFGRALSFPVFQSVGAFTRTMNTPARPVFGVDGDDEDEILALAEDYLAEVMS